MREHLYFTNEHIHVHKRTPALSYISYMEVLNIYMDVFNIKNFSLPHTDKVKIADRSAPPKHRHGEYFLKGPIPWKWITVASGLPGKALHVGIALWHHAGIKNNRTITLASKTMVEMGVKRNAEYRGINALERAGLVSSIRHRGRLTKITITEPKE